MRMAETAGTSWTGPSDGELLRDFAAHRREAAFAQIVGRHGGMVLAVCRSVLHEAADAEDAAQAVFLTLARKAGSRRVRASLAGWLHRVAWYVSARAAEARAIRRRHEQEAARMNPQSPPQENEPMPPDLLHAGLADLPEKYRLPLLLHHLEGRTQEETAALLGCGLSAVAMRLNRGRQMLRDRLVKRGAVLSAAALVGLLGTQSAAGASPLFVGCAAKAATTALLGQLATTTAVHNPIMQLIIAMALAFLMYMALFFMKQSSVGEFVGYLTAAFLLPRNLCASL